MKSKGTFPRVARTLSLFALLSTALNANITAQQQQQPQGMGVNVGSTLVTGARRTSGIVDPKAPVVFEDVTARTALAQFRNRSGSPRKDYIVETVTGGV